MVQRQNSVEVGMHLLALFSPAQVKCIADAVGAHGYNLLQQVEEHQVDELYPNNPLGALDPEQLSPSDIAAIARVVGLIWKDALVSSWTQAEYEKMIAQATGMSAEQAATMAKNVITNDDAALTKILIENPFLENFTFGAGPAIAKFVDDAIDYWTGKNVSDNLFEFFQLGEAVARSMKRMKMMQIEAKAEAQTMGHYDASEIRRALLPDTIRGLVQEGLAIREAIQTGMTETGEPFSEDQGALDLRHIQDLVQEGLRLMTRTEHPDVSEQGGWLGDALNFVAKAGKGIVKGVGKLFTKKKKGRGSIASPINTTYAVPSSLPVSAPTPMRVYSDASQRVLGRAPRTVGELEVVVTQK